MIGLGNLFFAWHVPPAPMEELRRADVILTHEFGDQRNISLTTMQIVRLAITIHTRFEQPIICQSPGNKILQTYGITPEAVIDGNMLDRTRYLDTHEVQRQTALICKKWGWTRVVVCTHPHHAWRVGANLRHHRLLPVFPDLRGITYSKGTSRSALASPWAFLPREVLSRLLYYSRGVLE